MTYRSGAPSSRGIDDLVVDLRGDVPSIELHTGPIPFVDLTADHQDLEGEILQAWGTILEGSGFIGGPFVRQFESELAAYLGVRNVIGVANGTDAIMLALLGLGIREGDEVITAANTFVATVEAIIHAGGRPVLVDVDDTTATIAPDQVEAAITSRTRFIIPVHLYGQPADMAPIMRIAAEHDLKVVEDNAQALGAMYRGEKTGSIGHAATTSFYPSKNLGATGDGGAIMTDDDDCTGLVRAMASHGQVGPHEHRVLGYNSRLDALQAAVLSIKLPKLDTWNARRRHVAGLYREVLGEYDLELPGERETDEHIYHLYVVRHRARDELARALDEGGVATGLHYPRPIHLMAPYRELGDGPGSHPVSEAWARRSVSLPIYPNLTDQNVALIGSRVEQALKTIDVRTGTPT